MHPNAEEAATMALQAGAKALACTHIGRFGTPAKILAEAREVFNASVTIPHDGTKFQL